MLYNFKKYDKYWQLYWEKNKIFHTKKINKKNKFYILDMFPYPSGKGLHVGHLVGYIASDIYSRYKRNQGYNVLHPMGFDSFGLPAEQYAIETGNHPETIIKINIKKYKKQLNQVGISFDWDREIQTSHPNYYKWTQWIFIQLFNSWYDNKLCKARSINSLIDIFNKYGNNNYPIINNNNYLIFSNKEWNEYNFIKKENILQKYRLAFKKKSLVNWCPKLGTVLANDEIKNGKSERGGYPVLKKKIIQWHIRTTVYANRLLNDLQYIDASNSLKEAQKNWIGKMFGLTFYLKIYNNTNIDNIEIFIKHPYYIFGVTFIIISSERDDIINNIIIYENIKKYKNFIKDQKNLFKYTNNTDDITGFFTGSYALHPFTNNKLPIYISNYILPDFDIIMGVPAHNNKDLIFAKKFQLQIIKVLEKKKLNEDYICINSFFLNGLDTINATKKIINKIKKQNIILKNIKYKIKDAIFSRQRYWGEPIPIYYKQGIPIPLPIKYLPLLLPKLKNFLPTKNANSTPLNMINFWAWDEKNHQIVSNKLINQINIFPLEVNTMPGWAGSSWYFLRYMDPKNKKKFLSLNKENYWKNVDIYIGGSEHTTGHLLYARVIHKFLKDRGWVHTKEPFNKIINQGIILSNSALIAKDITSGKFISYDIIKDFKKENIQYLNIDINLLNIDNKLDINKFKTWRPNLKNSIMILNNKNFYCKRKIEKMSKSKFNIITPDNICNKYGADTLRLYIMFIGPINQSKLWNDQGIIGIFNFLKKFWLLFHNNKNKIFDVTDDKPSKEELIILHTTIKKIKLNMEKFNYNTSISTFMICVNNLIKINCKTRDILQPLLILISPFAPHISEHLWKIFGYKYSISFAKIPNFKEKYLIKKSIEYPIMFNGKIKFRICFSSSLLVDDLNQKILENNQIKKFLYKKNIKKIIIVHKKIINIITD